MRSPHRQVHPTCPWEATTWSDCDKARDDAYQDWQAFQQVLLVYRKLTDDPRDEASIKRLKKDGLFGAMMRWVDGDAGDLLNDEGNPAVSPWAKA